MSECIITGVSELASGKFLKLEMRTFKDGHDRNRKWEAVQRQGNQQAVFMVARLMPSQRVLLIRQFRAPVGAYCLEVPAGLVDPGENPTQAAQRELWEETGYRGTVDWAGPASSSSAGLTGELVSTVFMTVDEALPENVNPIQHAEENEEIQVFAVPFAELGVFIKGRIEAGDIPDSRLVAWAYGAGVRW